MKTRNLDLGTDLLRKEQVSFPDIEERAYAYRKFNRENIPVKRTGKTDPGVKERGNASGHYSESRMMEGDFATLLSLYGKDGDVCSISRQGMRRVHYDLPEQGPYHRHQYIEVLYVIEGSFEQILLGEKRL